MLKFFTNLKLNNRSSLRFFQENIRQLKTNSTSSKSRSRSKNVEEKIKKQILFYIDNELPDKNLENELKSMKNMIKAQSELVRKLKIEDASKKDIHLAVNELLSQQASFRKKIEKFLDLPYSESNNEFDSISFEILLRHRFFYDQSFSIYKNASGFYDLGPLGCLIQNNLINEWRKFFVLKDKMHEVDCAILTPEIVLKASGHLKKFSDVMVRDTVTNEAHRVDHLVKSSIEKLIEKNDSNTNELKVVLKKIETGQINKPEEFDQIIEKYDLRSPKTNNKLTNATNFNLMFQTKAGTNGKNTVFMRPETAQGIFTNFERLLYYNQNKYPLVVAQIGKSFRNEINPRNGLIRQREFLMAEIEHFLDPSSKFSPYEKFHLVENLEVSIWSEKDQLEMKEHSKIKLKDAILQNIIKSETLAYYIGKIYMFVTKCGIREDKIRFRQHLQTEMAHYANECWDLECETSLGWIECAGLADRCDFDLRQHSEYSGKLFPKTEKEIIPHVIEPSFGIGRIMYTILEHNYKQRADNSDQKRSYFSFSYRIAPYKCCILPLNESEKKFQPLIDKISDDLTDNGIIHKIDSNGSIGKRYSRNDECGVAYAITLDYKTFNDNCVTLRERDSMKQKRINISDLVSTFQKLERDKIFWNDLI